MNITVDVNGKRSMPKIYPKDTKLSKIAEDNGIPPTTQMHINGNIVSDKSKTLAELTFLDGLTSAHISVIKKTNSAA